MLMLVETVIESLETLSVNFGRIRFLVFVEHRSLCTLLILLVDGLNIVVTNLKEDHGRWSPLNVCDLAFSFDRCVNMETENQRTCKASFSLLREALYHGRDDDLGELDRYFSPHTCQPIVKLSVDLRNRELDMRERIS